MSSLRTHASRCWWSCMLRRSSIEPQCAPFDPPDGCISVAAFHDGTSRRRPMPVRRHVHQGRTVQQSTNDQLLTAKEISLAAHLIGIAWALRRQADFKLTAEISFNCPLLQSAAHYSFRLCRLWFAAVSAHIIHIVGQGPAEARTRRSMTVRIPDAAWKSRARCRTDSSQRFTL